MTALPSSLPSSGKIMLGQVNAELGESSHTSSMNNWRYRGLAGKLTGPIKMSDFYGKSAHGISRYATPSTYTFTVPLWINSLTLGYATPTGINYQSVPVTPGSSYTVVIGNTTTSGHKITYNSSSFAGTSYPAINELIFSFNGQIDILDVFGMEIGTPSRCTLASSTGKQIDHHNNALAVGITLYEGPSVATNMNYTPTSSPENAGGDFTSTISAYTLASSAVKSTTFNQACTISYVKNSGRESFTIKQQPNFTNNWTAAFSANDTSNSGHAGYDYDVYYSQVATIELNW